MIVIDGPNGDTSEWVTTSGVIDSSSSSSNGIDECKCIISMTQKFISISSYTLKSLIVNFTIILFSSTE